MRVFYILFFFMLSLGMNAQDLEPYSFRCTNRLLSDVLVELEAVHGVKFSYNATAIKGEYISLNIDYTSLKQIIDEISQQVYFVFNKIDERYYIVKKNHAISVCGYLKDRLDKSPIEGGTIVGARGNWGTVSNKDGFFELKNIKESDTLTLSFLGYKSILLAVKNIQNRKCDTYILSYENHVLNEVVVQEYLASGIVRTQDGSVKIDPNDLEILFGLAEPDVLQNIQLLPGIENPSETASGLFIRGGTPDQNLILWDGIKMYSSDHFFGMLSVFNPYIIKDVSVYRNGVKPQYGDRISGVIDIRTDTEAPRRVQGGLGLNMTHVDAYLKLPVTPDIGVILSARRAITDILQTPKFNSFSQKVFQNTIIMRNKDSDIPEYSKNKEKFYFADITLKVIADISDKDKISIANLYSKNQLDYYYEPVSSVVDITGMGLSSRHALSIKNLGSSTTWDRVWNNRFSSRGQFYSSEYDLTYKGRNALFPDAFEDKRNNIREIGFSMHTDWHINDALTFSNGYQFFSNKVSYTLKSNSFESNYNEDSPTSALYSQISYKGFKNWYFDVGLRVNYYTTFNSLFAEPRLYLEKKLGEGFRVKGSAEIKYQAVTQIIELTTIDFNIENQVWILAKEDETPLLKSDQFSMGFSLDKKGWNIDVEAYYKNTKGHTSLTRGFEPGNEGGFSEGKSLTKGVDVLLKKKINRYSTSLGYTYSTTDFIFEILNEGKPFRGNDDITHSLAWSQCYSSKNFEFSLGWKYRTGIPYTKAKGYTEEGSIEYEDINSATLPIYHRLDFSALYKFRFSKKGSFFNGKIGFSLLNIYGRKNILKRSYSIFGFDNTTDNDREAVLRVDKFSLGLTPNIVFRLNF